MVKWLNTQIIDKPYLRQKQALHPQTGQRKRHTLLHQLEETASTNLQFWVPVVGVAVAVTQQVEVDIHCHSLKGRSRADQVLSRDRHQVDLHVQKIDRCEHKINNLNVYTKL